MMKAHSLSHEPAATSSSSAQLTPTVLKRIRSSFSKKPKNFQEKPEENKGDVPNTTADNLEKLRKRIRRLSRQVVEAEKSKLIKLYENPAQRPGSPPIDIVEELRKIRLETDKRKTGVDTPKTSSRNKKRRKRKKIEDNESTSSGSIKSCDSVTFHGDLLKNRKPDILRMIKDKETSHGGDESDIDTDFSCRTPLILTNKTPISSRASSRGELRISESVDVTNLVNSLYKISSRNSVVSSIPPTDNKRKKRINQKQRSEYSPSGISSNNILVNEDNAEFVSAPKYLERVKSPKVKTIKKVGKRGSDDVKVKRSASKAKVNEEMRNAKPALKKISRSKKKTKKDHVLFVESPEVITEKENTIILKQTFEPPSKSKRYKNKPKKDSVKPTGSPTLSPEGDAPPEPPKKKPKSNVSTKKKLSIDIPVRSSRSDEKDPFLDYPTSTPRTPTPRTLTPRVLTPRVLTPRISTRSLTPRISTPRSSIHRISTPRSSIQRISTPRSSIQRMSTPRSSIHRISTPRSSIQRISTPRSTTPKISTLKISTPKTSTPKMSTPEINNRIQTPEESKISIAQNKNPKEACRRMQKENTNTLVNLNAQMSSTLQESIAHLNDICMRVRSTLIDMEEDQIKFNRKRRISDLSSDNGSNADIISVVSIHTDLNEKNSIEEIVKPLEKDDGLDRLLTSISIQRKDLFNADKDPEETVDKEKRRKRKIKRTKRQEPNDEDKKVKDTIVLPEKPSIAERLPSTNRIPIWERKPPSVINEIQSMVKRQATRSEYKEFMNNLRKHTKRSRSSSGTQQPSGTSMETGGNIKQTNKQVYQKPPETQCAACSSEKCSCGITVENILPAQSNNLLQSNQKLNWIKTRPGSFKRGIQAYDILDEITLKDVEPLQSEYPRKDHIFSGESSTKVEDTLLYQLLYNESPKVLESLLRSVDESLTNVPEEKPSLFSPPKERRGKEEFPRPNLVSQAYQMYEKLELGNDQSATNNQMNQLNQMNDPPDVSSTPKDSITKHLEPFKPVKFRKPMQPSPKAFDDHVNIPINLIKDITVKKKCSSKFCNIKMKTEPNIGDGEKKSKKTKKTTTKKKPKLSKEYINPRLKSFLIDPTKMDFANILTVMRVSIFSNTKIQRIEELGKNKEFSTSAKLTSGDEGVSSAIPNLEVSDENRAKISLMSRREIVRKLTPYIFMEVRPQVITVMPVFTTKYPHQPHPVVHYPTATASRVRTGGERGPVGSRIVPIPTMTSLQRERSSSKRTLCRDHGDTSTAALRKFCNRCHQMENLISDHRMISSTRVPNVNKRNAPTGDTSSMKKTKLRPRSNSRTSPRHSSAENLNTDAALLTRKKLNEVKSLVNQNKEYFPKDLNKAIEDIEYKIVDVLSNPVSKHANAFLEIEEEIKSILTTIGGTPSNVTNKKAPQPKSKFLKPKSLSSNNNTSTTTSKSSENEDIFLAKSLVLEDMQFKSPRVECLTFKDVMDPLPSSFPEKESLGISLEKENDDKNNNDNTLFKEEIEKEEFGEELLKIKELGKELLQVEDFGKDSFKIDELEKETFKIEEFEKEVLKLEDFQKENEVFQTDEFNQENFEKEHFNQENFEKEDFNQENFEEENLGGENLERENLGEEILEKENFEIQELESPPSELVEFPKLDLEPEKDENLPVDKEQEGNEGIKFSIGPLTEDIEKAILGLDALMSIESSDVSRRESNIATEVSLTETTTRTPVDCRKAVTSFCAQVDKVIQQINEVQHSENPTGNTITFSAEISNNECTVSIDEQENEPLTFRSDDYLTPYMKAVKEYRSSERSQSLMDFLDKLSNLSAQDKIISNENIPEITKPIDVLITEETNEVTIPTTLLNDQLSLVPLIEKTSSITNLSDNRLSTIVSIDKSTEHEDQEEDEVLLEPRDILSDESKDLNIYESPMIIGVSIRIDNKVPSGSSRKAIEISDGSCQATGLQDIGQQIDLDHMIDEGMMCDELITEEKKIGEDSVEETVKISTSTSNPMISFQEEQQDEVYTTTDMQTMPTSEVFNEIEEYIKKFQLSGGNVQSEEELTENIEAESAEALKESIRKQEELLQEEIRQEALKRDILLLEIEHEKLLIEDTQQQISLSSPKEEEEDEREEDRSLDCSQIESRVCLDVNISSYNPFDLLDNETQIPSDDDHECFVQTATADIQASTELKDTSTNTNQNRPNKDLSFNSFSASICSSVDVSKPLVLSVSTETSGESVVKTEKIERGTSISGSAMVVKSEGGLDRSSFANDEEKNVNEGLTVEKDEKVAETILTKNTVSLDLISLFDATRKTTEAIKAENTEAANQSANQLLQAISQFLANADNHQQIQQQFLLHQQKQEQELLTTKNSSTGDDGDNENNDKIIAKINRRRDSGENVDHSVRHGALLNSVYGLIFTIVFLGLNMNYTC